MPPHDPAPGTGVRLEIGEIGVAQRAGGVLPDRFEHRHDVDRPVAPACPAGSCRRRRTPTGRFSRAIADDAARHVLVAAADRDDAVEALRRRRPSRSNRRSPRATPASTSCPRCPSRCASDTVMVLKMTALPPAASAPAAACRASSSMCTLHGVTWLQVEQMPICGLAKSSRVNPTACSIARPARAPGPSSTFEECGRALSSHVRIHRGGAQDG